MNDPHAVPIHAAVHSVQTTAHFSHANRFGLTQLRKLIRKVDIQYWDEYKEETVGLEIAMRNVQSIDDNLPLTPFLTSVRKVEVKRSDTSSSGHHYLDLSEMYMEICIMSHPALQGHSNILELLGITLLPSTRDSLDPHFGLVTTFTHGTLEDLLAVERKTSRDPRSYLIPWSEREDIAIQCAEGLAALHDCNILHNNVQPSSFTICISNTSPSTRKLHIQLSCFGNAVPLTPNTVIDGIVPANGQWSWIGPLANCVDSPFCRDIHSFGLVVMYMCYYEFMDVQESMDFLRTQKKFYDELGMHPALNTELSLFHVVSRCCISHGSQPITMHWVAPTIEKNHESVFVDNRQIWLQNLVDIPSSTITELIEEFKDLRRQQLKEQRFNAFLFHETLGNAEKTSDPTEALYLSLCFSSGIGTIRDEYPALQWCIIAAERGSIPAKSIAKMLHDAYSRNISVENDESLQKLQYMGKDLDRYLVEALQAKSFSSGIDEDMTRMCWSFNKSYPFVYSHEIYPTLKWPVIDQLLRIFIQEHRVALRFPAGSVDHRIYPNTLSFTMRLQLEFPLRDGSTILHCLAQVVCPNKRFLPILTGIAMATGSDIAAVRNDGRTAADLAVQFGNTALVACFLETYFSLGFKPDFIRPLVSTAVEWHHWDILKALTPLILYDQTHQTVPLAASLLADVVKRSKLERIISRGKTTFEDAQRAFDCIVGLGGPRVLSTENPQFLSSMKEAVLGCNDDILSYNAWTMVRALSAPLLNELMEHAIYLGERSLLKSVIRFSKLDHSSVLKLLNCAIQCPLVGSMQMLEIILDCYPIAEEEFVVDLVRRGAIAADMVSKLAGRNPHILTLRFGVDGQSLLHHAIAAGKLEMAMLLTKHGAGVNIPDEHGNTPLHIAIENTSNDSCVSLLLGLQQTINLEHHNKAGQTPLLHAVYVGNLFAVRQLLERHANVKAVTNEGFTALHLAYSRFCDRKFRKLTDSRPYLIAKVEEKQAGEVLGGTLNVLKEYGADEMAVDYVMGFTAKSYFAWMMETMAGNQEGQM